MSSTLTAEAADAFRQRCHDFLSEHTGGGARRDVAGGKVFQQALAAPGSRSSTSGSTGRSPNSSRR
jgi:hypothetical protein